MKPPTKPRRKRKVVCIKGGRGPCPTCPVSADCRHGQKKLYHNPEIMDQRITAWIAEEYGPTGNRATD